VKGTRYIKGNKSLMQAFLKHKFSEIAKALMKVKVIIDKNLMKRPIEEKGLTGWVHPQDLLIHLFETLLL
jgi:hypothetical protein